MKHIKLFEELDDFTLDDNESTHNVKKSVNFEEEEPVVQTNNDIEQKLNDCINDCQQILNTYNDDKYKAVITPAASAVEISQLCLNIIKRNYGPVSDIKNVTKKMLQQCSQDFKKNSHIEMAMQCADKCDKCISSL